jgi:hypothetical protein
VPNSKLQGLITYSYLTKKDNSFAYVQSVSYKDSIFRQFIGEHDILNEIKYIDNEVPNVKSELTNITYL